ncbi:MAG: hypothetical protein ABW032_11280 [Burkholderiaceae bacterium]
MNPTLQHRRAAAARAGFITFTLLIVAALSAISLMTACRSASPPGLQAIAARPAQARPCDAACRALPMPMPMPWLNPFDEQFYAPAFDDDDDAARRESGAPRRIPVPAPSDGRATLTAGTT